MPTKSTSAMASIVVGYLLLLSLHNLGGVDAFALTTHNTHGISIRGGAATASSRSRLTSTSERLSTSAETASNNESLETKPKAIVVGGGPVGLATALTLSNAPHGYDVEVFETSNAEDYCVFDPAKAYLYLINERGQVFTKKFPALHERLQREGVPSSTGFVVVPSTTDLPIPEPKTFSANPSNQKKASEVDGPGKIGTEIAEEPAYWIPRHAFTNMLLELCREQENDRVAGKLEPSVGSIRCHFGQTCLGVQPSEDNASVTVRTKDTQSGTESSCTAKLVVGGDGMNSKVRESLVDGAEGRFAAFDPGYEAKQFKVKRYKNPATDLRLKALQLPAKFKIIESDGGEHETTGKYIYSIKGVNTGPRNFVGFGLLPMMDDSSVRPANVITRPDHEVWAIDNGEDARLWFQKNFPRMNFQKESEGGMISDQEWERFAKAEGTRFPYDQYSPALQVASETKDCGVVLLGDAAHAFPPSIGQGINAGLADVVQFDRNLKGSGSGDKPSLFQSLRQYQKRQGPETRSLIRLARFGSPYQYNQAHYIDRFRKMLWTMNVVFRVLLNKISFGVIPPPMIMMVMNKGLSYRQMARRADITTAAFFTVLASLLVKFLKPV